MNKWIVSLLLFMLLAESCSFGDDPSPCPYNVRMEYWYAGSGAVNSLPTYVDNLRQYLFDSEGELLGVSTLRGDSITGWNGNLTNGTYTLVLWANLGEEGRETETVQTKSDKMNITDMLLSAEKEGAPPGYRDNTARLYYGTTTFTVEDEIMQRKRVYLSHAHAALSITVRWMTDEPVDGLFRMRLKGIPAIYGFTGGHEETVPSGDGTYTLPRVERTITYHEARAARNYEGEVIGEFVTFRYTAGTHQLWSLWRDGEQIIRDLDLNLFFSRLPMNMDTNMEQEFDLLISVFADKIVVTQATAADWDEGGAIG